MNVPGFRAVIARGPEVEARSGSDGVVYLRHPEALSAPAENLIDLLNIAIARYGDRPFLTMCAPASGPGTTYASFGLLVAERSAALRRRGFKRGDVAAVLAANSVEHAVVTFAVLALGGIVAPLSPMHLAHESGRTLLGELVQRIEASWLFTDARLEPAVLACGLPEPIVLAALALEAAKPGLDLVEAARAIAPADPAKVFFTSGTTGAPKPVINTHAMLTASAAMVDAVAPRLPHSETPVILDWLPWHHTYGGNINLHTAMLRGGAFFIDDGLPTPDRFGRTLENLAAIQPTQITNVPVAYPMLVAALKADPHLARQILANVRVCSFGGAALSPSVVAELQTIARETLGETVIFGSGYGMTESSGILCLTYWPTERTDLLGLPLPGETLKLVPHDGVFECRVAGPNVFTGYAGAAVSPFDDEGFFPTGDLVRPAVPGDWSQGLVYEGRLAEDFKLSNGVFVRAGPLREALLDTLRPLAQDVLLCGVNRDAIGALIWPSPDAPADVDASLRARIAAFNATRTTASTRIARAALAASPPGPEEITAKGTLNIGRASQRRADEIDALFGSSRTVL